MYPVSAAYKTAIGQNVRDVRITGTITLKDNSVINITDEDIVQGSLYITEQCVAGEDIEVGNVYASEMGLSLSMPLENPYSLDGARILINFGINVETDPDEPPIWEYVPLGYFYVTEIQRKANNVNLTALDGMLLFDIPVGDPGSSSPRNFVVHACEQAGVPLGTSVFEIDTFANATLLFAAPDASKIKTCRDLLMWACQIMGAFARMNRQGELEIVPIKARPSVKTINKAERFNSDVSDFAVKITKVSMQVGETVYSRGTDGMTMVLEENPLMTGLSESQINAVLDNLLAQITTAVYVPFNSNFIGDPALQPGDFVTLADTSVLGGGDVASIITHSTWSYRGPHNIKGAGKHGLVRGVQNQQMKAVSSIVAIARAAQDLALAANQSTQLIKDAIGGHVLIRQNPDETNEILIMDNPDPDQAVKIWRWNMGGLGYSDNCVGADNPDREYEIAMTMDGAINANFIKTGQLDAGVVRIGPETTFAPGYDPSQIEGASAVGMGVDADCLGLWHFDGSLNSHKGVPVVGDANFDAGCFGQAVRLDEPTTNLAHHPSDTAWWNAASLPGYAPGPDITYDANEQALKVDAYASSHNGHSCLLPIVRDTYYTITAKIKNTNLALYPLFSLTLFNSSNGVVVTNYVPEILVDENWTGHNSSNYTPARITFRIPSGAYPTATKFTMQWSGNGGTLAGIYIKDIQIEQKPYPTAFAGYNTSRLGILKAPTTGLSASQGTISFRAKNLAESGNGSVLIDLPDLTDTEGLRAGIANDGKLFIEGAELQFQSVETSQADFQTGTLVDVVATSAGNLELVRDGQDFAYSETTQADFQAGTLTNVVATEAGDLELALQESDRGLRFDGVDDYVNTNSPSTLGLNNTIYKIEIRFKGTGNLGFGNVFGSTGRFIYVNPSDGRIGINGANVTNWTNLYASLTAFNVIVVQPGIVTLNGVSQAFSLGNMFYSLSAPIRIGTAYDTYNGLNYGGYFSGDIDYVKIWSGSTLKLFWELNETSGTTASDSSGNGKAGTLVNGPIWVAFNSYVTSGSRVSPIYDIGFVGIAASSTISWNATTPAGTSLTIETNLSLDGGVTWQGWQVCTNGGAIPGITEGTDLSNARLQVRQTLNTTDTTVTPQLHSLSIYIYAPYKSSGYRYKEYDISAIRKVGSSKITWTENKPASTTLTVKAAVSTDGGSSYSSFQPCTNGGSIPGLTQGMDISNARLKVQEDLATSDETKTPQLQSLTIEVGSDVRAYGPSKSTLTGWDSISLAWKPERLSLVVNDSEACYIENPGLPASLGSHIYIGTDRNGANAINTLVDELRIDKVYREVNIRTGWHKMGVPFYTSEDMKQWPGYLKAETDGWKVYDSSNALRVLIGSWLKDAVRKYGIKIIDGEIYSSIIRSGAEDATEYIQLVPPNRLQVWYNNKLQMDIGAVYGGTIDFYHSAAAPNALDMVARISGSYSGADIGILANDTGKVVIGDNLFVTGNITASGSKPAQQVTENYGLRYLYAIESPEILYFDRYVGRLENGEAVIKLDPIFLECIEPDTELTPWSFRTEGYGENDIYVAEWGKDWVRVKERNGGTSNNKFVLWIEAVRKNYAGIRLMEVTN